MAGAQSSLLDFRKAAGLAGGALAALSGVAMAGAINEARKFEAAMVELEKVTDPSTAEEMSGAIKDMAETIPLAQQELAAIASDAGRFGIEGSESIQNFTEAVAKMATATNISSQEAGESLAKLAELTNTPISEVENLGSSINELSNNFATSAQEIVDSMMRSAGAMSQFGLTQTEIAGFSAALNEVSESSERAGTRMRRLVQEISNPKKIQDMAAALGMNVEEYQRMQENNPRELLLQMIEGFKEGGSTADQLNKNLSTTSRQALAGLSQNLDGVNQALGMSADAFEENTSLQKEFDAATDTFNAKLQTTLNRLRNVAITIGNVLLPYATRLLDWVASGISRFQDFNEATNGVAATVGLIATFIGGLGTAIAAFMPQITAAASLIGGGFTAALGSAGAALSALLGPVGLVVAAVVGLVAVFSGRLPQILNIVDRVFAKLPGLIRRGINAAINWVMNTGIPMFRNAVTTLARRGANAVDLLSQWLPPRVRKAITVTVGWIRENAVPMTRQAMTFLAQQAANALGWLQANLPPFIRRAITAAINWVRNTGIPLAKQGFRTLAEGSLQALQWLRKNLPTLIKQGVKAAINWVRNTGIPLAKSAFQAYINAVITIWGTIIDRAPPLIKKGIRMAISWLRENGPGLMKRAFELVGTSLRETALLFLGAHGALMSLFRDFATFAVDYLKTDAKGDLTTAIEEAFDALVTAGEAVLKALTPPDGIIAQIMGDIRDYLRNEAASDLKAAAEFLFDVVIAAAEGLYDGLIGNSIIPEMLADVISAVRNWDLPGAIRNKVDDALGEAEDFASDFKDAGKDLLDTFIDGIKSKTNAVGRAVDGAVQKARDKLPGSDAKEGPLSDLTASGAAFPETIAAGIEGNQRPVDDAATEIAETAMISPDGRQWPTQPRREGATTNVYNIDVDVPQGTDVDTAARTIADEVKSIGMND